VENIADPVRRLQATIQVGLLAAQIEIASRLGRIKQ
jgi:hypothetical protein